MYRDRRKGTVKRKYRQWRIFALTMIVAGMLFCLYLIFASLKKNEGETRPTGGQVTETEEVSFMPSPLIEPQDPENENLAGMLQEKAAGVMVRILAGDRLGSGVIWEMNEQNTVILTAGHVLADTDCVEVTLVDGSVLKQENEEYGESWKIVLSETVDLGILILPTAQISDESLDACRYASVDKEAFDDLVNGDILIVMGCKEEVAGNAYEGKLTDPWIYMQDYSQYMMLAHTYAQPGMSGGGVFDQFGHLVGILSGADEKGNLAVVPLSLILTEVSIL